MFQQSCDAAVSARGAVCPHHGALGIVASSRAHITVAAATVLTVLTAISPCTGAPLPMVAVAPGVYVYTGTHAEADSRNLGAVANATAIIGTRSVAVIDTGGSHRFGKQLRATVESLTDLPVSHVINTHVHPDHILGNAAFTGDDVEFIGHHKLPRAFSLRAPHYLQSFSRLIGPGSAGSALVAPQRLVTDTLQIDLGDRRLTLHAHPTAHTDHDLSIFDHATGTLIAGDLVFMERLPVVDGSLKGWLAVMDRLRAAGHIDGVAVQRVVPGHGPASAPWPEALANQQRYLRALLSDTRAAVARGDGIQGAISKVAPQERARWLLFEENHARNVTTSYAELEWE